MPIPCHIKIGPIRFRLKASDRLEFVDGCAAKISYRDTVIRVDTNYDSQMQANSIMHEVLHGVLYREGETEQNNDEGFVERVSTSILCVLFESPGLLEYLMEVRDA